MNDIELDLLLKEIRYKLEEIENVSPGNKHTFVKTLIEFNERLERFLEHEYLKFDDPSEVV